MKAILVIDMPDMCLNCDLYGFQSCYPLQRRIDRDGLRMVDKPEWCPLKPISEEEMIDAIPISFLKDKIDLNKSWGCYGYAKGLQSAIDEWEKQNESNISD